uniref:Flavin reductase like domain-containing protein n=1 Tax=Tetradesmus obliquus TaxID=3088 RepID=A0A383W8H8_TETOB|eukprot:jgi/Sobl393_1/3211/SZX73731.1
MPDERLQIVAAFAAGAAAAAGLGLLLVQPRLRQRQAVYVQRPHPGWAPPQKQQPPHDPDNMHEVDPSVVEKVVLYPLVISAIVPRPIGFAATISRDGCVNLSPYSYFNVMGHNPCIVAMGISRSPGRGGGKKDTLQNIEETKEFTLNMISDWFVEAANHTCGDFERGVDEFQQSGLTPVPSKLVKPPRVRESAVQMECKLRQVIEFKDRDGKPSNSVVLGEVVLFHIADGVAGRSPSGKLVVDPTKLQPVCRLGGVTYGRVTELYDIPRPNISGANAAEAAARR